jgi:TRAP-type C4-dicarboxylate transport system permease small subunit
MLITFGRLLGVFNTAALWIAGAGLVGMTASVAWQVFGRYVLNDTPTWVEPLSIQLMGWFILLGAAVGVREGYHLGFEILRAVAPRRVARAMAFISDSVVTGFGAAMAWYGMTLVSGTWAATLPILGWPGGFDYLPLVGGGTLIALFGLERIVRSLASPAGSGA